MKKLLVLFAIPCALLCAADNAAVKPATAPVTAPKPNAPIKPGSKMVVAPPKPVGSTTPAAAPKVTPKAAASPKTASAPSIPAGATEVEPFLYRYQDTDGKKWLYRQTPFGIVKMEDKPAAAVIEDHSNPVTVTDQGESVKFEKNTPFGRQSWTRKKT